MFSSAATFGIARVLFLAITNVNLRLRMLSFAERRFVLLRTVLSLEAARDVSEEVLNVLASLSGHLKEG